ncbi:MAG: hypothetical protein P4L69_06820 [Desulfosporosinus sp.]|nr:hypothetical protein [Desulfosporosinus sp.]
MPENTKRLIFKLMQYNRTKDENIKIFNKLKHNADLCPKFQKQLEQIFQSFNKYRTITYDIQGIKDEGTDIVVRQNNNDNSTYLCLQVKSQDDLEQPNYLQNLKAQLTDSYNAYGDKMIDYYILLCCDTTEVKMKNKVRMIEASFNKIPNVHVIEPQYALFFLNFGSIQLDAVIRSQLGSEDIVFRSAFSLTNDFTPSQLCIIYFLTWRCIFQQVQVTHLQDLINNSFICHVYSITPDYDDEWFFSDDNDEEDSKDAIFNGRNYCDVDPYVFTSRGLSINERISMDLDYLKDNIVDLDTPDHCSILVNAIIPIIAFMTDAYIRYEYEGNELLEYMLNVFGPLKGYTQF